MDDNQDNGVTASKVCMHPWEKVKQHTSGKKIVLRYKCNHCGHMLIKTFRLVDASDFDGEGNFMFKLYSEGVDQ